MAEQALRALEMYVAVLRVSEEHGTNIDDETSPNLVVLGLLLVLVQAREHQHR